MTGSDRVWVGEKDRPFAHRLARYCARNPVALERLRYDAATAQVTYRSDKTEGPTAGSETLDALEFLGRLVTHIPDRGQVLTRSYGWYANRTRGIRRRAGGRARGRAGGADAAPPVDVAESVPLPLQEARRRWAELLRRIFEGDPLATPWPAPAAGAPRTPAVPGRAAPGERRGRAALPPKGHGQGPRARAEGSAAPHPRPDGGSRPRPPRVHRTARHAGAPLADAGAHLHTPGTVIGIPAREGRDDDARAQAVAAIAPPTSGS